MVSTFRVRSWLAAVSSGREHEFTRVIGLTAVQGFLWSMMIPVLPLFARSLGATEIHLGAISTMPALITIVGSIPGSALSLRYGKRAMFLSTHVLGAASALLFSLTRNLGFILFPQLMFGLSNTVFWPTQMAYLTEMIPREIRPAVMGYTMAMTGIGMVAGPILGGALIDSIGYQSVFIVYAIVSGLGLLIGIGLPKGALDSSISAVKALVEGMRGVKQLLDRPFLRVLALNTFFLFLNVGMTDAFYPVLLKEAGFSATWVGSTVTVRTAGITLIRIVVGSLVKRLGVLPLLFASVGICALALGLVPFITAPGFVMAASFVMGLAFGMAPVLTTVAISENTEPRERAVAMALDGTTVNFGRVLNGFGIGALAQVVGFGNAIVFGNIFVLSGLGLVMTLYARLNRGGAPKLAAEVRS